MLIIDKFIITKITHQHPFNNDRCHTTDTIPNHNAFRMTSPTTMHTKHATNFPHQFAFHFVFKKKTNKQEKSNSPNTTTTNKRKNYDVEVRKTRGAAKFPFFKCQYA